MRALKESNPQRLVQLLWLIAVSIVVGGVGVAYSTGEGHWVDKSGKVIVATSFLLTYLQFRFELGHSGEVTVPLEDLEAHGMAAQEGRELRKRVQDARGARFNATREYLLTNTLVVAAGGELLSAFGADLFAGLLRPH